MIKIYQTLIGSVVEDIEVVLNIQKTKHAGERQSRNQEDYISDYQIKKALDDALVAIAKSLMMDDVNIGEYVCIKNDNYNPTLNIIGTIKRKGDKLQFVVITIMKKNNFRAKSDTFTIHI